MECAGLANEAQVLLLSSASLAALNQRLAEGSSPPALPDQFRPNLLVGGPLLQPFQEDSWDRLRIGPAVFEAAGLLAVSFSPVFPCLLVAAGSLLLADHVDASLLFFPLFLAVPEFLLGLFHPFLQP